jgi:hypothetical protein
VAHFFNQRVGAILRITSLQAALNAEARARIAFLDGYPRRRLRAYQPGNWPTGVDEHIRW